MNCRALAVATLLLAAPHALAADRGAGGTLGGGVVLPVGPTDDSLDRGWDAHLGFASRINSKLGLLLEGMYTHLAVTGADGDARIWSGTLNAMLGPGALGTGLYVIGGGGVYGLRVLDAVSTTKPGVSGGVGLRLGKTQRLYLEARYHYVFTDGETTQFVPINLGIRW